MLGELRNRDGKAFRHLIHVNDTARAMWNGCV